MVETNRTSSRTITDEAYMSLEQLRYFRDRLLHWRKDLCARVQGRSEDAVSHGLPDWIDSASHHTLIELSWAERERSLQTVRQIDAALGRIEAGTYGYCAESGEEIGIKRLMAMPIALYSIETQNDLERRGQMTR